MIDEREFYKSLKDELNRRSFFIVTDFAPEDCIGICGINGKDKVRNYAINLQENYRLAAIKNFIFTVGQHECAGGFFEILVGSRTKEFFPTIFINIKHEEKYYKMAYSCSRVAHIIQNEDGKEASKYIIDCLRYATSALMEVLQVWIVEGRFPFYRFSDGKGLDF